MFVNSSDVWQLLLHGVKIGTNGEGLEHDNNVKIGTNGELS